MAPRALEASLESVDARSIFIGRTYLHLLGAALCFVLLEAWLFASGAAETIARGLFGVSWLLVLGAFILVGWIAAHFANQLHSRPSQYLGLGLFVVAEALIFVPLLWRAERFAPGVIGAAGVLAITGFGVLTAIAFHARRDFSFLRPLLLWGGFLALSLIVISVLFGVSLGPVFAVAMVGFAGAAILHDTSRVLHEYAPSQYVAAALELFSSFALLLWYVVSLLTHVGRD